MEYLLQAVLSSQKDRVHRPYSANQSMVSGGNVRPASEAPDSTVHPGNPITNTTRSSTAVHSIAANETRSDSLLSTFLVKHVGINRNSLTVEAVRYQWELTREVACSFCLKSDYQVRIIRIKQYDTAHHLEEYRGRNTNPAMLFPLNQVTRDKTRK